MQNVRTRDEYIRDDYLRDEYIRNVKGTRRLLYNVVNIMSQQEHTLSSLIRNDSRYRNHNTRMHDIHNMASQPNTPEVNRQRFYSEMAENMRFINTPRITITTPQPVRSAPTPEEINRATINGRFSSINNPLNNVCPISRDPFASDDMVTQIIPCGHIFSRENLNLWFSTSVHCPMCRYDIRNYEARRNVIERRRRQTTRMRTASSATSGSATSGSAQRSTSANRQTIDNFANLITNDILRQLNTNMRDSSNNLLFEYTLMTPQNVSSDNTLPENDN